MSEFSIERHRGAELPEIELLCTAASTEGHSFVERTRNEWSDGDNRFDRAGECFFVGRAAGAIVGMCGVNLDPFLEDPSLGRLRHLYVHPESRRLGVGRALVDACRDAARGHFDRLRLRTFDPDADLFYRSIGFCPVNEETATHSWRP